MAQAHTRTWTVHSASLLKGGWLSVRDNALKNATALWLELPRSTTASGTKQDRRRTEKLMTYVHQAIVHEKIHVAVFAPGSSNTWELEAVKEKIREHKLKHNYHGHCAWGAVDEITGQPKIGRTQCYATYDIAPTRCQHTPDTIHVGGIKKSRDRATEAAVRWAESYADCGRTSCSST